jgi:phenylalanyl-tRNA synthetase alpha chain
VIDKIEATKREAFASLLSAVDYDGLEETRIRFLGKKGQLTSLLRQVGQLPEQERASIGQAANETRRAIEALLAQRREELSQAGVRKEPPLDITLPGTGFPTGSLHPLTQTINQVCDIFIRMGYNVVSGPEIESEYYNFIALNIPPDHPARDDHASFYIRNGLLLRTETSAVQIRVMEKQKTPVRIISPGRCYRRDAVDATHCHTFHQVEGLYVDKGVNFSHLKGTLQLFARELFGPDVKIRFRPDFFPFTEPSAEVSVGCVHCRQRGCRVCHNSGWLELAGCGMVHPRVLENVGYNPEKVTGFAFGMGAERLAMQKFGIPDIRLFYENDLRFLRQFAHI